MNTANWRKPGLWRFPMTAIGFPTARSCAGFLEYSRIFHLTAITHAEDKELSSGGSMNEGVTATRLGLRGHSGSCRRNRLYRDLRLARLTGASLHVAHISTAGSVAALRQAKAEGLTVTGETAPHYFTLTEEAVTGYRTETKMNPPLRTRADLEAGDGWSG